MKVWYLFMGAQLRLKQACAYTAPTHAHTQSKKVKQCLGEGLDTGKSSQSLITFYSNFIIMLLNGSILLDILYTRLMTVT